MSKRATISQNQGDADYHRLLFKEFAELELDLGGPDAHADIVELSTRGLYPEERAWRAGVYVAFYTIGGAAAFWENFSFERAVKAPTSELENFIRNHWAGLPMRRESRARMSAPKMATCLKSVAEFVSWNAYGTADFDTLWTHQVESIKYFGRYAKSKYIESLRRAGLTEAQMYDIRPAGGWSPRWTLSFIYPERDALLNSGKDDWCTLDWINRIIALDLYEETRERVGDRLDWFKFETLLCNYRQALEGRHPGRTHDTELEYWRKANDYWGGLKFEFYRYRRELFPRVCLGEAEGWGGTRPEPSEAYQRHGYLWSDLKYDYRKTRRIHSWVNPVLRH